MNETKDSRYLNYVCLEYPATKRNRKLEVELCAEVNRLTKYDNVDFASGLVTPSVPGDGRLVSVRVRNAKVAAKVVSHWKGLLQHYYPKFPVHKLGDGASPVPYCFVDHWKLNKDYYGTVKK